LRSSRRRVTFAATWEIAGSSRTHRAFARAIYVPAANWPYGVSWPYTLVVI
jgi:hypothetical protein